MSVPRVKICGITRVQDALAADQAGADAIGLVFYPPSVRNLSDLALARDIALTAGPFTCVTALFVNAQAQEVDNVLRHVPVNLLQFHGEEEREYCESFGLPYIKALRVKDRDSLEVQLNCYPGAAGLLLDTWTKDKPGGTGESFNWELVPRNCEQALVLAGGLSPDNVAAAIKQTGVYGVDVSGGVESAPGIKSAELIRQFINNAKRIGEA